METSVELVFRPPPPAPRPRLVFCFLLRKNNVPDRFLFFSLWSMLCSARSPFRFGVLSRIAVRIACDGFFIRPRRAGFLHCGVFGFPELHVAVARPKHRAEGPPWGLVAGAVWVVALLRPLALGEIDDEEDVIGGVVSADVFAAVRAGAYQ